MSLNVQTALSQIIPALQEACGLDSNNEPLKNPDGSTAVPPSSNTFASDFTSAYNTYASAGIVLGATNTGAPTNSFTTALEDDSNNSSVVSGLASALAEYWSQVAIIPAAPAFGGVAVVNVENDALTKVGDFESAMNAAITDIEQPQPYKDFLENVEAVVKSITWFVTESQTSGGPITHETNIT